MHTIKTVFWRTSCLKPTLVDTFFARMERTVQRASRDTAAQLRWQNVTLFLQQLPFVVTGCAFF